MLITLDFETYYDSVFSLSKMTTEEYIRSPMFESIGFGLKVGDQPAVWHTGTHEEQRAVLAQVDWSKAAMNAHNNMFDAAILHWRFGFKPARYIDTLSMGRGLVGLLTSCSLEKLGEYLQLQRRKGHEVVKAMGKRRLDFTPFELAEYGRYCVNDVEMCHDILAKLAPCTLPEEMLLQDWTIRCFAEPKLLLNGTLLRQELLRYHARKDLLLRECGITDVGELRSDETMANLLMGLGVDPPTKASPKQKNPDGTPKRVWAFSKQDPEFMDLVESDDEQVVALVEARLGVKSSILQSRIERLIGISERGPLPVPLSYAGATPTRRWAGTDQINIQNFPRNKVRKGPDGKPVRDEKGKPIIDLSPLRQAIIAPPGKKMAAPDLSQIELRVNCWQSGQLDTLEVLRNKGDVYSGMASDIFGFPVNKKDHENERFVGKTAELGCGYQCGAAKFHHMLKVDSRRYGMPLADESFEFAQRAVQTYRAKKTRIVNFWHRAHEALSYLSAGLTHQLGPYEIRDYKVWLPNGSYLYYPDLRMLAKEGDGEIGVEWSYERMRRGRPQRVKFYGGKFVENITQAVARLFVSDALLRLDTVKYTNGQKVFDIVFSVHDELCILFDDALSEEWVTDVLAWAFTTTPSWAPTIPLGFEVGYGYNYAECK